MVTIRPKATVYPRRYSGPNARSGTDTRLSDFQCVGLLALLSQYTADRWLEEQSYSHSLGAWKP